MALPSVLGFSQSSLTSEVTIGHWVELARSHQSNQLVPWTQNLMVSVTQSSEVWMSVWNWGARGSRVGGLHTSQGISDSLMCQDKIAEDTPQEKGSEAAGPNRSDEMQQSEHRLGLLHSRAHIASGP